MLYALLLLPNFVYLTNPPQNPRFDDTGRRFQTVQACEAAGRAQFYLHSVWRCEEKKDSL